VATSEIIVVAIAIVTASFTQVVAGFGFALLAMPIMTLALPVDRSLVIVTLLASVTTLVQAIVLRAHTDRVLARRLAVASFAGMPVGLVVLNVVDDTLLRVALGTSVLVATAMLARQVSLAHVGPGLDVGAGFLAGVLSTSLGTNGPPIVFDLQSRGLDPDRFRATIQTVFAAGNLVAVPLFVANGTVTGAGLTGAAIAVPAWLTGLALGLPARRHVAGPRFRFVVLALLVAAGTSAIAFALSGV
jgi:uncharacterized membrane protein YfcA